MDQEGYRGLVKQLAEDVGWLEELAKASPTQAIQAGQLRLSGAVMRNILLPFLEDQAPLPLHVAVVGGAGAGKSTLANMLAGAGAAESNPQAGYTRHPIAYQGSAERGTWSDHLGFLGPLERLSTAEPANLDADVYQVRNVRDQSKDARLLETYVVWDCPDMTTWASAHYVPRLLEVAALADVLVYVASDERYNDEVPTQFLRLLLRAGKSVLICLVKMRAADAPAFVEHFRKEVLANMPVQPADVLTIPQLTRAQLADPVQEAQAYREPIVEAIRQLGTPPTQARTRSIRHGLHFVTSTQDDLLGIARAELGALDSWRGVVRHAQVEFDTRYRREFLTSERFRRFDEALIRLLQLLELPGVGKIVSTSLYIVRTPYRLLKGLIDKTITRPVSPGLPERRVLEASMTAWIDYLRKEAVARSHHDTLWAHIHQGFTSEKLAEQIRARFEEGMKTFQVSMAEEVERTARAIHEELEKSPVALNTLRGSKITLEVAAITGAILTGGAHWGLDFLLVPLYASVTHQLVELVGKQYVDFQREQARARQQALVSQYLSGPLAEWIVNWPSSGGSVYERLQIALRRIPPALQQLEAAVKEKLGER